MRGSDGADAVFSINFGKGRGTIILTLAKVVARQAIKNFAKV